jgi:hypothetical protein
VGREWGVFVFAMLWQFFPFFFLLWGEGMRVGIFCTVHFHAFENLGHVTSPFMMEMKSIDSLGHIIWKWKSWLLGHTHTHTKNTTYIHTHTYTMA